jgi:putative DNA primase/helicase
MRGNAKKIFKLLAIINGCLRFSFHGWQQFVHLIGAPGSGKGTFARLMEKIVGKDNTQPCSLDSLKDGSTLASIIDKQLVVFGDERKPVGVESILRLTGGDSVNYREVYRPAANAYFYGLLLICSNDPIFMGNTTGLERRLCLVEFNNPIPKALRNPEMEASFDSEIASLIAIALSLPSSEVKQAVQGIGDAEIADFKAAEWEMKVRMDSLAAFFEMELIVEEGAQIRAGDLFNRYKDFCEEIKKPAMSLTTFSPGLEKLCTELHQPVTRDRSGRHVTFIGLRLRGENDEHPTYSQKLAAIAGLDTPNTGLDAGLDAGLATIQSKDLQDLQDLTPNILENCEISEKQPSATEIVEIKKEVTPPSPAAPVKPLSSKAPSAAQSPAKVSETPAASPATKRHHKEFKVGDRVRIVERGLHHGKDGTVLAVYFGNTENAYKIALDKESHLEKEVTVRVPHSEKFPVLMSL